MNLLVKNGTRIQEGIMLYSVNEKKEIKEKKKLY